MEGVQYKQAETKRELLQILSIQNRNLPENLDPDLMKSDGFLTIEHNLELLTVMNGKCPHSIAVHNNQVVGYALSMHPDFSESIDILKSMFDMIAKHVPEHIRFVIMGQICVDRHFREQGVFRGLYDFMKNSLKHDYDWIITEVDLRNQRSLNAHLHVDFQYITRYRSGNKDWGLIYLPINQK